MNGAEEAGPKVTRMEEEESTQLEPGEHCLEVIIHYSVVCTFSFLENY